MPTALCNPCIQLESTTWLLGFNNNNNNRHYNNYNVEVVTHKTNILQIETDFNNNCRKWL